MGTMIGIAIANHLLATVQAFEIFNIALKFFSHGYSKLS
jgi:hypothetical protein